MIVLLLLVLVLIVVAHSWVGALNRATDGINASTARRRAAAAAAPVERGAAVQHAVGVPSELDYY